MTKTQLSEIKKIFASHPEIKLAYLFGSRAMGRVGPLSDYDFAVYFGEKTNKLKMSDLQLELMVELGKYLHTDDVDVVVINTSDNAILKFHTIAYSKLLLDRDGYKVMIEPRIVAEYLDFRQQLIKHNLTKIK